MAHMGNPAVFNESDMQVVAVKPFLGCRTHLQGTGQHRFVWELVTWPQCPK